MARLNIIWNKTFMANGFDGSDILSYHMFIGSFTISNKIIIVKSPWSFIKYTTDASAPSKKLLNEGKKNDPPSSEGFMNCFNVLRIKGTISKNKNAIFGG
ncbi:MAG: hypothetical protein KAS12_00230 [Candidatus Aenigmarchaeota archaeon]|nr:hypothetical protein [Candidatus Aenigmarchaeota archaeon]